MRPSLKVKFTFYIMLLTFFLVGCKANADSPYELYQKSKQQVIANQAYVHTNYIIQLGSADKNPRNINRSYDKAKLEAMQSLKWTAVNDRMRSNKLQPLYYHYINKKHFSFQIKDSHVVDQFEADGQVSIALFVNKANIMFKMPTDKEVCSFFLETACVKNALGDNIYINVLNKKHQLTKLCKQAKSYVD